ncbi:MAG: hypothetical protein V4729_09575 [Pseudomonadota bacterium]
MTREDALRQLATEPRFSTVTAGDALQGLSQAFQLALTPRDLAFFEFHRDDPCHEVARACAGGHNWRGDETCDSGDKPRKPHWRRLEQETLEKVTRKT